MTPQEELELLKLLELEDRDKRAASPQERSWGEALYDTGQDLNVAASSVIKGVGTAAGLLPGVSPDNAMTQFADQQIKQSEAAQSPALQAKRQALQQRTQQAEQTDGQWGAFKEQASGILSDPALLGSELTKLVPQMLPAAGAARTAAAFGAGAKAVMAWAVGVGAGQQSADVAGEVYEEAIKQGHSPDVAKEKAMRAAMVSAPISVASQFAFGTGGRAVERFLSGQKTGVGAGIKTVTKAITGEAGQETFEEVGGQMVKNIEAGAPLSRGVGATAATASILGALPGAVGGINDVRQAKAAEKDLVPVLEDIRRVGEEVGQFSRETLMGPPEPKKQKMKQEQMSLDLPVPEAAEPEVAGAWPYPDDSTFGEDGLYHTTVSQNENATVEKITNADGTVDFYSTQINGVNDLELYYMTAQDGAKYEVGDKGDGTYSLDVTAEDNNETVDRSSFTSLTDLVKYLDKTYGKHITTKLGLGQVAKAPMPNLVEDLGPTSWKEKADEIASGQIISASAKGSGLYDVSNIYDMDVNYTVDKNIFNFDVWSTKIGSTYYSIRIALGAPNFDFQIRQVGEDFPQTIALNYKSWEEFISFLASYDPDVAKRFGVYAEAMAAMTEEEGKSSHYHAKLLQKLKKLSSNYPIQFTKAAVTWDDNEGVTWTALLMDYSKASQFVIKSYGYDPNVPFQLMLLQDNEIFTLDQYGDEHDLLEVVNESVPEEQGAMLMQGPNSYGEHLASAVGFSAPKLKTKDPVIPFDNGTLEALKDFDQYVSWIDSQLAANGDVGWFRKATAGISKYLSKLPRFSEWYKKAYFKNKDGTPWIWVHATAQDIANFIPKQANAIFMTQAPEFSQMFHGMSENWMVNNLEKVLNQTQLQAFLLAVRTDPEWALEAQRNGNDIRVVPLSELKRMDRYHKYVLQWLPSRRNSMPLVTNVQFVWDWEKMEDVERLADVLPSWIGTRSEVIYKLKSGDWHFIEQKEVRHALENLGYEAFHTREGEEKHLAVMDTKRVKSAIGNPDLFGDNDFLVKAESVEDEQTVDTTARVPFFEGDNETVPIFENIKALPIGSFVAYKDNEGTMRLAEVVGTRMGPHESGKKAFYPRVRQVSPNGIDPAKMPLFELHPDEIVIPFVLPIEKTKTNFIKMYGDHKRWMAYLTQLRVTGMINQQQMGKVISQLHLGASISKDSVLADVKLPVEMISADGIVDTKALFKWLIEDEKVLAERPDMAALAGFLANQVGDVQIRVAMENGKILKTVPGKDNQMANYNPGSHTITLGREGFHPGVILHEMVHAATYRALLEYFEIKGTMTSPRIPVEQMPPAVQRIYRQYLAVLKVAGSYKYGKEGKSQATLGASWQYGLMNLGEFVSEAMTNRTFQLELVKIAGQPEPKTFKEWMKSAWGQLMQSIGTMLGMDIPESSMMAEFLYNFSSLVELQEKKNNTIARELRRIYNNPLYFRDIAPDINYMVDGIVAASQSAEKHEANGIKGQDENTAKEKVLDAALGDTVDWIPEDPVLTDKLKEKILGEVDGADLTNWYAGGLQASEVRGSTLIGTIYRLMDNASKRAERFNREYVKPLERLWQPVLRDRRLTRLMHAIFTTELKATTQFTEEQLSRWLTPKEINSYLAMRQVLDLAIDEQNDALLQVGLKPVTPLEAYFASRWSGPWRSVIRNAEGKIVWVVAENTKGKAQKAVAWLKARNPMLVSEEVSFHHAETGSENKLQAGYAELLKMLDPGDKDTNALREAWENAMVGVSENIMNQEKHFKNKTGVRGFRGDRPWADSYEDSRDFFLEQFKYLKAASEWAYMQTPLKTAKDILTDPEIALMQKNNVTYSREYIRQYMGYGTSKWVDGMENSLSEWFSWLPSGTVDMAIGSAKTLFYISALGYNMGYMIYALLQPMLGAGKHARLSTEGYRHNVGWTLLTSISLGLGAVMHHYTRQMLSYAQGDVNRKALDAKIKELRENISDDKDMMFYMDYIEDNGIIDMSPHTDIQDLYVPEGVVYARRVLGATTGFVEAISRAMCFFSFVAHLHQSGKGLSKEQIAQMADEATKDVMADYRPNERAMIFQKAGLSGKALSTLQTFKFNWMSQVVKYSKMGYKDSNWRPFLSQMSVYLILAGALGSVGLDDLDDLWYFLLSGVDNKTYMEWKDRGPKAFLMRNLNGWLAYGAVAQATGTNLHTRGSLGDVLPWDPNRGAAENFANWIPFVGSTYSAGAAAVAGAKEFMGKGNPDNNAAAIYKGLPAALKGPVDVKSDMFNYGGMSLSTADPELGVYRRSEEEKTKRMFGLRSQQEYETMEGRYRHQRTDRAIQKRLSDASDAFTASLLKGDARATKYLEDYITLGGDPKNLVASGKLTDAVRRKALDYSQQLMLKARPGNRAAIQSLIDYYQSYAPNR